MPHVFDHLPLLLSLGLTGVTCGWCLRKGRAASASTEDEVGLVPKVLASLQTWIARLSGGVGEHHRRMERLSHDFADAQEHETTAVAQATARLIRADEQLQQQLTEAGAELQRHAQQIGEDPHQRADHPTW